MPQKQSDYFCRELDQLQTWKDHSSHKISHNCFEGPPKQPSFSMILWKDSQSSSKAALLVVMVMTRKECRLESDKRKSTEGRDQEKPQVPSPQVCASHRVMDTLLSQNWLCQYAWGTANQGRSPEPQCSGSLFRLLYLGMVHCPCGQPWFPAPPGTELCDPNPYPTSHHWSSWGGQPLPQILFDEVPTPNTIW